MEIANDFFELRMPTRLLDTFKDMILPRLFCAEGIYFQAVLRKKRVDVHEQVSRLS